MNKKEILSITKNQSVNKLKNARRIKDDEWYTLREDIETELEHYTDYFYHKDIICPCDLFMADKGIFSVTIKNDTILTNTVKQKATLFSTNNTLSEELSMEELYPLISEFGKYLISLSKDCEINSITISGLNPFTNQGISFEDIDYAQYDLCITNPPFSMYSQFMDCMVNAHKRNSRFNYILLAPFLNRVTPNIGLPLMRRECYLGFGRQLRVTFNRLNNTPKTIRCDWITTFNFAQEEINSRPMENLVDYISHKDEYYEMTNMTMKDGTHPIRVNSVNAIPKDYNGYIFTTIGVLDFLSYSEYDWWLTNAKGYFNKHINLNPFNHKLTDSMIKDPITGKGFHGIIIKRK